LHNSRFILHSLAGAICLSYVFYALARLEVENIC
jgi:hypothetical protein